MAIEKTFILVKPDGVKKNLVGNILARFEAKGLKIVALKMIVAPKEVAETHYAEHKEKPGRQHPGSFRSKRPENCCSENDRCSEGSSRNPLC